MDDGSSSGSQPMGGFGFGVGVSFVVVVLILVITLTTYYCTRSSPPPRPQQEPGGSMYGGAVEVLELGLDEATLRRYPKLLYSQAIKCEKLAGESTPSSCSICLGDYRDKDVLRLLPDCGHVFHLGCVDPWLRHRPTCPVCRSSPLPTPLSTPLAEVAPLAASAAAR